MSRILHLFTGGLAHFAEIVKLALEIFSIVFVTIGLFTTLQLGIILNRRHLRGRPFAFSKIRINFGKWLSLALEFQLGADIVATTVAPTIEELAQLGLIAIIRTFLNYFLNKELEAELNLSKQRLEITEMGKTAIEKDK